LDVGVRAFTAFRSSPEMGVLLNLGKFLLSSSYMRYGKIAETSVLQPSVHGAIIPRDIQNQVWPVRAIDCDRSVVLVWWW